MAWGGVSSGIESVPVVPRQQNESKIEASVSISYFVGVSRCGDAISQENDLLVLVATIIARFSRMDETDRDDCCAGESRTLKS